MHPFNGARNTRSASPRIFFSTTPGSTAPDGSGQILPRHFFALGKRALWASAHVPVVCFQKNQESEAGPEPLGRFRAYHEEAALPSRGSATTRRPQGPRSACFVAAACSPTIRLS
jgi:hypothetical protein